MLGGGEHLGLRGRPRHARARSAPPAPALVGEGERRPRPRRPAGRRRARARHAVDAERRSDCPLPRASRAALAAVARSAGAVAGGRSGNALNSPPSCAAITNGGTWRCRGRSPRPRRPARELLGIGVVAAGRSPCRRGRGWPAGASIGGRGAVPRTPPQEHLRHLALGAHAAARVAGTGSGRPSGVVAVGGPCRQEGVARFRDGPSPDRLAARPGHRAPRRARAPRHARARRHEASPGCTVWRAPAER